MPARKVKTLNVGQRMTIGDDIIVEAVACERGGARLKVIVTERERYSVVVLPNEPRDSHLTEAVRDEIEEQETESGQQ